MAWEQRNDRWYYYRKKRLGKRVVSEYVGAGQAAELFDASDRIDRNEKLLARENWNLQKQEICEIDDQLVSSGLLIRGIVRAHFLLAGYHPHKGQLRRRRNER